ncbi:MAG TPA: SPW repeat protein [Anaeromyxobacter sp.]|nr:SPW repeat protein [Anaeromyxobacter sp.]
MARWVNVVLGAWLIVTAVLVGPAAPEFGDHLFLGLTIFLVAFLAMALPRLRILNLAFGAWAVLSPFVFGYEQARFAFHDIVVGILVIWAAITPPRRRRRDRGPLVEPGPAATSSTSSR